MSSGLLYVPGSYADKYELTKIAKVVSDHGEISAGDIRGEGKGPLGAANEDLQIGRGADLPVHVSHFTSSGKDNWAWFESPSTSFAKSVKPVES